MLRRCSLVPQTASRQRACRRLAGSRRSRGCSRSVVSAQTQQTAHQKVLCKSATTTHPRTLARRRHKVGIISIIIRLRRARRVTRCWTSGSSGAYRGVLGIGRSEFRDHTTVGKRFLVANHASSAITYVYMLASRVRQAQEIQLHGASMHANVVPVYTQQERGDRSYRRIGRTSCTQCLLPCRSP